MPGRCYDTSMTAVALPQLSADLERLANLEQLMLRDETLLGAALASEDVSGVRAKGFAGSELRLEKVTLSHAKLEKLGLTDTELLACELIATAAPDSSWRRVLVKDSHCSGLQLQASVLQDVTFVGCKLTMANFRFAKLKNVCFTDCTLDEADFYEAQLQDVIFKNCSLDRTEFSGAKLKQVDFRTSDIVGILGLRSLAGATIDSIQLVALAPLLAGELRITVKD